MRRKFCAAPTRQIGTLNLARDGETRLFCADEDGARAITSDIVEDGCNNTRPH